MQTSHHRRRETFLRLKDFAASHSDIPATTVWPQLVTDLNTVNTDLEGHAASEAANQGAALQGTDLRGAARAALREDLEAIVRTARAIDEDHPGFKAKFRMPDGTNDQDLIDAALGMATNAAPADVKALFISHALPADFLEDLQEDVAEFQSAITDQSGKVGDRKSSGVSIDVTVDRGMSIRRKMDAVVRNFYRDNAAVLAEWETASHIERGPRGKKAAEEPPKNEPPK